MNFAFIYRPSLVILSIPAPVEILLDEIRHTIIKLLLLLSSITMARKKRSFQSINKLNEKKNPEFHSLLTEKGKLSRNPYCSHNRITEIFACGSSTIGDILREKDKWLSIKENDSSAQFKKKRPPKWPQLEEAMTVWLDRIFLGNQDIE